MGQKIERFESLREFSTIIAGLDDYRTVPIATEYGGREIRTDKIKAMVNITHPRICMTVNKNYPVFGHREALGYVEKELVARKCEVHGQVQTVNDRTYTTIFFKGLEVSDAKDSRVELGVFLYNPMDRKTKFKGYGYTWRQTCSNGAGLKVMLPNMEINESHTADMLNRVPPVIHDFIGRSLDSTNYLQTVIEKAMGEKVVFATKEELAAMLRGYYSSVAERHIKGIIEQVGTLSPTRWELFNASSYYTSHYAVGADIRSDIDTIAENFLDVDRPIIRYKPKPKV